MVIKRSFTVPPVPSHLEKWGGGHVPPCPLVPAPLAEISTKAAGATFYVHPVHRVANILWFVAFREPNFIGFPPHVYMFLLCKSTFSSSTPADVYRNAFIFCWCLDIHAQSFIRPSGAYQK